MQEWPPPTAQVHLCSLWESSDKKDVSESQEAHNPARTQLGKRKKATQVIIKDIYVIKVEGVSQGSTGDQKHKEHPQGKKDIYQGECLQHVWGPTQTCWCVACMKGRGGRRG